MEKNLYKELGLKKNATKSEIKSSYRSLVKQHHPDAGEKKNNMIEIFSLPVHHLIHLMTIGRRNLIQKNTIHQLKTKKLKLGLKKFTPLLID